MNLIKPKKLKTGDTIGIVATSGNLSDEIVLNRAISFFENKGFKVVVANNVFEKKRYLAGNDEDKVFELHKFFADTKIDAIIALRGGFGAIRLIEKIDYELIKNNPKIFVGYSDISALSGMFLKKSNLITYSGPMCCSDFGVENLNKNTINNFFEVLMEEKTLTYSPYELKIYKSGEAKGIAFGGNLATITSLCGLDFVPDENFIFFIEDLNEPVYKIDRMLTQLFNIAEFRNKIKGIIVGEFLGIDNEVWLVELFKEIGENYNIPVLGDFRITHGDEKLTIPYGAFSKIADNKFIIEN